MTHYYPFSFQLLRPLATARSLPGHKIGPPTLSTPDKTTFRKALTCTNVRSDIGKYNPIVRG